MTPLRIRCSYRPWRKFFVTIKLAIVNSLHPRSLNGSRRRSLISRRKHSILYLLLADVPAVPAAMPARHVQDARGATVSSSPIREEPLFSELKQLFDWNDSEHL